MSSLSLFDLFSIGIPIGFLSSRQSGQHLLGKLDVAVGSTASAILSFQNLQQGFHIGSRGVCFFVIEIGPDFGIITLGLETPEAGLLDHPDLAFDSILISDDPFMVASHRMAKMSVDCRSVDMT